MAKCQTPWRILVTGSAGAVGKAVCRELIERGHHVRGFDLRPSDDLVDSQIASITNRDALFEAAAGMDMIVHLAATPDEDDFVDKLVPNNVIGVYHVFEAARTHKLRRVILASTSQVVNGLYPAGKTIYLEDGPAPTNHYGLLKLWAEQLGKLYVNKYNLSVIAVRIGALPRDTQDVNLYAASGHCRAIYLSQRDAGRFFANAVECPSIGYAVLFATSHSDRDVLLDIEPAKRLLGYEPIDVFPQGLLFPVQPLLS